MKRLFIFVLAIFSLFLFACKTPEEVFTYNLTYILNGSVYEEVEVKSNEDIVLEEIEEKGGIIFSGWFKDEKYTTPFTDTRLSADTTVYGYYEEGKYRVNFVTNCDVVIEERLYSRGDFIEDLPTLEKEGYNFIAWYRDADYRNTFNLDTDTVGTTLTLYAKWQAIEPDYVNIRYVSITEGYYANKDDIYVAYYSYFYDFLKNHTDCDLTNTTLEDFLIQGKTWSMHGRSEMYHVGYEYGRYYLKSQRDGTLEEQPENYFLGYCYKNGKFIDLINHLEEFFAYWRTDEGYTGSRDDPENVGNDFYIEPWASMVDTAKFFFFTADTLQTKYAWFTSERVKYALDHIPNVVIGPQNEKIIKGEEYTINVDASGYILTFYLDEEGTIPIDSLNAAQTSCDECDEIIIYVKIEAIEN
ncbi:MAG: InlB B-repeat-containing protein [Bacilli bacterium]|nr:InlB B-repeat-containing protein [Bacilli bacterium]